VPAPYIVRLLPTPFLPLPLKTVGKCTSTFFLPPWSLSFPPVICYSFCAHSQPSIPPIFFRVLSFFRPAKGVGVVCQSPAFAPLHLTNLMQRYPCPKSPVSSPFRPASNSTGCSLPPIPSVKGLCVRHNCFYRMLLSKDIHDGLFLIRSPIQLVIFAFFAGPISAPELILKHILS